MKKIALLMLLALPLIIISCEKEHSDPTISEETFPTILGQWPSGNPAVYNVTAGEDLTITSSHPRNTRRAYGIWTTSKSGRERSSPARSTNRAATNSVSKSAPRITRRAAAPTSR